MVEHATHNRLVTGSNPVGATKFIFPRSNSCFIPLFHGIRAILLRDYRQTVH